MHARRIGIAILSLILALLAIFPIRAQGPGPKGGPFVPGAPPPRSPAFREAAGAALRAYLQAHGLRLTVECASQGVAWGGGWSRWSGEPECAEHGRHQVGGCYRSEC